MLTNQTTYDRFMTKVVFEPSCGCWIWSAAGCPGYGQFGIGSRDHKAHIVSYVHFKGPIPAGKEIDHICRLKCCVNPDHLRAVTRAENIRAAKPFHPKKFKSRQRLMHPGLQEAIKAAGSARKLADAIGLSEAAVSSWERVPVPRAWAVERATGVSRKALRPDFPW